MSQAHIAGSILMLLAFVGTGVVWWLLYRRHRDASRADSSAQFIKEE